MAQRTPVLLLALGALCYYQWTLVNRSKTSTISALEDFRTRALPDPSASVGAKPSGALRPKGTVTALPTRLNSATLSTEGEPTAQDVSRAPKPACDGWHASADERGEAARFQFKALPAMLSTQCTAIEHREIAVALGNATPQVLVAGRDFNANNKLYNYNPSVKRLAPLKMTKELTHTYLALIRRTNHNSCNMKATPLPKTYQEQTTVAVLDAQFREVSSTVLEFPVIIRPEGPLIDHRGRHVEDYARYVQDCRLFYTSALSADRATPQPWMSCFQRNVQKVARLKIIDSPGKLGVEVSDFKEVKHTCERFGAHADKNFQYFESGGSLFVEFMIEPHCICKLDLTTGICSNKMVTTSKDVPRHLSGGSPFLLGGQLRGNACCAKLSLQQTPSEVKSVFVGVGHFKRGQDYSHVFYAFESEAPFKIVATSAEWCISTSETAPAGHLRLRGNARCASLQFVSSIDLVNATHMVLAYGEFDCRANAVILPIYTVMQHLKALARAKWGTALLRENDAHFEFV